jgi:hypothetical protein
MPTQYNFFVLGGWAYRRLDIRLRKDLPQMGRSQVGITLDVFNVFNYMNFGDYDRGFRSPTFGQGRQVISDPRRVQLGVEYTF